MSTLISLPQRLQIQNGSSPVQAGVYMLPLLLLSATGSALGGILGTKKNVSWYVLFGSSLLQIIGLALMSTLPVTGGPVQPAQYGCQVILGLGFGLALSSVVILVRLESDARDLSKFNGRSNEHPSATNFNLQV